MTEKEWEEFFNLLVQIVNMELALWEEKMQQVINEARGRKHTLALSEFVGWNWPEDLDQKYSDPE